MLRSLAAHDCRECLLKSYTSSSPGQRCPWRNHKSAPWCPNRGSRLGGSPATSRKGIGLRIGLILWCTCWCSSLARGYSAGMKLWFPSSLFSSSLVAASTGNFALSAPLMVKALPVRFLGCPLRSQVLVETVFWRLHKELTSSGDRCRWRNGEFQSSRN